MFEFAFMQRALIAALIIGLICGVLGFFVVLRRFAFIGVGISHSAIGGVAIGILLGVSPLGTAAIFAVAVALGIAAVSRRATLSEDAVIGVFFSGSMALGIVLFSMNRGFQQDLFGYLFGNVLAITPGELKILAGAAAVILVALALLFKEFLLVAFDEEIARAYGHRVDLLDTALLVLLAVTIILGVRLVGVLLIEALLVVPAATAALWARNFRGQVALSVVIAVLSGALGLAAAYQFDIAAGGAIVLVAVGGFFASLTLRSGA
jgi:ABC-type Mn2+/Zn2+ transport system permease subunit